MERSTSRRDFLKGKSALRAAEQLLDRTVSGESPLLPPAEPDHYLVKYSRTAMACTFEIWLNAGQYREASETAISALDLIEKLEAQLTVYRESSEISQLNRTAFQRPIEVETRLFHLLTRSVELWQLTGGAFDITAGPLSDLWGFKRREGRMPDQAGIAATLETIGSQHLALDEHHGTVRFRRSGIEINLGAIGKGYALDRCAEWFEAGNIHDYLIHGGNSSVLARGSRAAGDLAGWSVGVRHPLRPQQYLGELHLRNKALSTSGSGTQFFEHAGQRYGHILDPRTGWPASRVLSVTAIAATAAEAEALSTACYVLGPAGADALLSKNHEFACLMICPGEGVGAIEVHSWNLEEGEWAPQ
jgi:thiamine biosynthesis lipoprotein